MNYYFSPHTGEHIDTDAPADWMGVTPIAPPVFDAKTQGLFFVNGIWSVVSYAPPLADVKAKQIAIFSAACQAQIYAGFKSAALGSVHDYPSKDKDQANLAGSVIASLLPGLAAGWTTPFWCADLAGAWLFSDHTAAQIQQVGTDGKAAILAALAKNAMLAAQVNAAATVEAAQAAVW